MDIHSPAVLADFIGADDRLRPDRICRPSWSSKVARRGCVGGKPRHHRRCADSRRRHRPLHPRKSQRLVPMTVLIYPHDSEVSSTARYPAGYPQACRHLIPSRPGRPSAACPQAVAVAAGPARIGDLPGSGGAEKLTREADKGARPCVRPDGAQALPCTASRPSCSAPLRAGARRLSGAHRHHHRSVRARRPDRHHRAHSRQCAVAAARPAIHCRQPRRRLRQYRHGAGRRARRPTATP